MKPYDLLIWPHPLLRQPALPVDQIDAGICEVLDRMHLTMIESSGIGLAANQVGVLKRLIVIQLDDSDSVLKLINPEVVASGEDVSVYNEGCLSFPGEYEDVARPAEVKIRYWTPEGTEEVLEADGLLATCVQHEIDHLDGKVFTDYVSAIKRTVIRRRMKKAYPDQVKLI